LPSWASPGYRNCMVGTFADVVIADAIVKNISCFDYNVAVQALLKDAYEEGPRFAGGSVGKEGLREYIERGYLSASSGGEVVSRTLDYGFSDFSTSQAILSLLNKLDSFGHISKDDLEKKAVQLYQRSIRAYTSLYDKKSGFMLYKDGQGRFNQHFSSIEWGNGYTEGNAWHHSFPSYAISCMGIMNMNSNNLRTENPWDCHGGLVSLHGGKTALLKKLHDLLTAPSDFQVGSYHQEIHEMREMRAFAMGQYGHNNQPVHHILYLFTLLGDSRTTQYKVREVLQRGYGIDFYAGDEDNGEQGAWFVLSALGLYSITPGTKDYVLGSPLFRHVRIARNSFISCLTPGTDRGDVVNREDKTEKYLDIFAPATSPDTIYVSKVFYDDKEIQSDVIDNSLLMKDGILRFVMEGESITTNDQALYVAKHRMSTLDLEADKADSGYTSKVLEKTIHEQQEQIDYLQVQLSKERGEM
jgi:predicted alpha-1,2-mannosidase